MAAFRPDPSYHSDLHGAAEQIYSMVERRMADRERPGGTRRAEARAKAAELGRLANSLGLAGAARRTDTELAHLTPGEIVVPLHAQTTSVLETLALALGPSLPRYIVGSGLERRNPVSGHPEYAPPLPDEYRWVRDPMGWVGVAGRQIADAVSGAVRVPVQAVGAAGDVVGNYVDMRLANVRDADKYFHCKANFEAAQRGGSGAAVGEALSDAREWYGRNIKGDPITDSNADQIANRYGRTAAQSGAYSTAPGACARYRPRGLPTKY